MSEGRTRGVSDGGKRIQVKMPLPVKSVRYPAIKSDEKIRGQQKSFVLGGPHSHKMRKPCSRGRKLVFSLRLFSTLRVRRGIDQEEKRLYRFAKKTEDAAIEYKRGITGIANSGDRC